MSALARWISRPRRGSTRRRDSGLSDGCSASGPRVAEPPYRGGPLAPIVSAFSSQKVVPFGLPVPAEQDRFPSWDTTEKKPGLYVTTPPAGIDENGSGQ
jgi:hypothetical protein